MTFFINDAHADEAVVLGTTQSSTEAPTPDAPKPAIEQSLMSMLPLVIIFAVFYFMLIRPQMKKQKEHQKLVDGLKKGDKVILSNGMIGVLVKIEEDPTYAQVEIAQNVKVRMLRSSITDIFKENGKKEDSQPASISTS